MAMAAMPTNAPRDNVAPTATSISTTEAPHSGASRGSDITSQPARGRTATRRNAKSLGSSIGPPARSSPDTTTLTIPAIAATVLDSTSTRTMARNTSHVVASWTTRKANTMNDA